MPVVEVEVKRLEVARHRRTEAERLASDEVVEENRQKAVAQHQQWVHTRRAARQKVVRRIEAANRERAARIEEHAASVRRYEESVAKLEAKKAIRDAALKEELDGFRHRQSAVLSAVYQSEVGSAVMTDGQLEGLIAKRDTTKRKA